MDFVKDFARDRLFIKNLEDHVAVDSWVTNS